MPQLNTSPWFFVMITTWITMTLLIKKLMNTPTHSTPSPEKNTHTLNQHPWPW